MALLFAEAAERYAAKQFDSDNELSAKVSDLFDVIDNPPSEGQSEDVVPQKMFMTSVANEYYKKS
ncbi:MAG: hypothetical protein ACI4S3_09050, partial [Candidatus Gastranaerophilaceae bacterium]